jgi:hypothetical protein
LGIELGLREPLNPFQQARFIREGAPFLGGPIEPLPPSPIEPLPPSPVEDVSRPVVKVTYESPAYVVKAADARSVELFKELAKATGKTRTQLERDSIAALRKIVINQPVRIRAYGTQARLILKDGRFKSQFETRDSGGEYDPELRAQAEHDGMGVPFGIKDAKRPIYGFYDAPSTDQSIEMYGNIEFVLNTDLKKRTTITVGDSLEGFQDGIRVGTPVSRIDRTAFTDDFVSRAFITEGKVIEYVEAQVHGGVTLDDVTAIRIILGQKDTRQTYSPLAYEIRKRGIPIIWVDGRTGVETPDVDTSAIPATVTPDIPAAVAAPATVLDLTEPHGWDVIGYKPHASVIKAGIERAQRTFEIGGMRLGKTADEMRATAYAFVKKYTEGKGPGHRTTGAAALKIFDVGRFMHAMEYRPSVSSDFDYKAAESRGLGVPRDISVKKRPIYGTYETPDDRALDYGPVEFVFKPEVARRTTITLEDSFTAMTEDGRVGVPVTQLDDSLFMERASVDSLVTKGKLIQYIEAQIHGGVTLDDVAGVRLYVDQRPGYENWFLDVAERARQAGLDVTWVDDETRLPLTPPLPPSPIEQPLPPSDSAEDLSLELRIAHPDPELLLDLRKRKRAEQDPRFTEPKRLAAIANVNQRLMDVPVSIAIDPKAFKLVLEDGRFKTQFETGTSGGYLGADRREAFEQQWMGVPQDIPHEERPVYGYMQMSRIAGANSVLEQYGKLVVNLKWSVRKRTTVTGGDSMDNSLPGSPLENKDGKPDLQSESFRSGIGRKDSIFGPEHRMHKPDNPLATDIHWAENEEDAGDYIEAQIWGGVRVEDIDSVYDYGNRLSKDVRDQLAALGIRVVRAKNVRNYPREYKQAEDVFYASWRARMKPGASNGLYSVPGFAEAELRFQREMEQLLSDIYKQRLDEMGLMTVEDQSKLLPPSPIEPELLRQMTTYDSSLPISEIVLIQDFQGVPFDARLRHMSQVHRMKYHQDGEGKGGGGGRGRAEDVTDGSAAGPGEEEDMRKFNAAFIEWVERMGLTEPEGGWPYFNTWQEFATYRLTML